MLHVSGMDTAVSWVHFRCAHRMDVIAFTLSPWGSMLFSGYCQYFVSNSTVTPFMGVYSEREVQWPSTFVLLFNSPKAFRANSMIKMGDQMG